MPAINVTSFDHVTIICADLEATRRFYVDFLGMTEVPRPHSNSQACGFRPATSKFTPHKPVPKRATPAGPTKAIK